MVREAVAGSLLAAFLISVSCGGTQPPQEPAELTLEVGEQAPLFTLPDAQGSRVSIQEFKGRSPVLLYFSMGPG